MQESSLRNLNHGDRDSLGLFQQRPSQGWGTPAQVTDPAYAARKFYDGLDEVDGWERLPLWQAAQAVQRSGHPHRLRQVGGRRSRGARRGRRRHLPHHQPGVDLISS
jgi:hypothetical protein